MPPTLAFVCGVLAAAFAISVTMAILDRRYDAQLRDHLIAAERELRASRAGQTELLELLHEVHQAHFMVYGRSGSLDGLERHLPNGTVRLELVSGESYYVRHDFDDCVGRLELED